MLYIGLFSVINQGLVALDNKHLCDKHVARINFRQLVAGLPAEKHRI